MSLEPAGDTFLTDTQRGSIGPILRPELAQQLDTPLEELRVQRELVYEVSPRRPAHVPIPEQPCGYQISVRLVSDQEDTKMTPRCGAKVRSNSRSSASSSFIGRGLPIRSRPPEQNAWPVSVL